MQAIGQDWRSRLLRELPGHLLRPLGYLPGPMTRQGVGVLCNQLFATALIQEELSFLDRRVLRILIEDAGIEIILRGEGKRLRGYAGSQAADVTISGTAHDLLLLMGRREDADTLFFQRRLRLEGDTELGLYLKNFLDAWEPPAAVQLFQRVANHWLSLTEAVTTEAGARVGPPR